MKTALRMLLLAGTAVLMSATSQAAGLPGSFPGVTIEAKLIGGQQYEALYARIKDWEAATGAKVNIISKKSHFEIDREIKSDMAAGTTSWCVGSNHSSFAPQYAGLYADLRKYLPKDSLVSEIAAFGPAQIEASTLNGDLVMLPRAQFDVSALYFQKSLYTDKAKAEAFKAKYGYDLAPPDSWAQVKDQAIFFSNPPNFYGFQYAGKDEAIVGRFYELLIAEGGIMFGSKFKPTFNSDAGVRALQWFTDLYKAGAVPKGVTNYVWDDLGQGFASGTIALDLDWPGWAGFFNDPSSSKVAGNVGVIVQPAGSSGKRTGWSGHHGFSITSKCTNKEAAASLVWFLTNEDSQKLESSAGPLPTRTAIWAHNIEAAKADPYRQEILKAFSEASKHAFPVPQIPEWGEVVNVTYPELQAAIVGDKTAKQALDAAVAAVDKIMKENGYY